MLGLSCLAVRMRGSAMTAVTATPGGEDAVNFSTDDAALDKCATACPNLNSREAAAREGGAMAIALTGSTLGRKIEHWPLSECRYV